MLLFWLCEVQEIHSSMIGAFYQNQEMCQTEKSVNPYNGLIHEIKVKLPEVHAVSMKYSFPVFAY